VTFRPVGNRQMAYVSAAGSAQRLAELRRWWSVSNEEISNDILETFASNRYDGIQYRLLRDFRTCPAKSPAQFREWCRNRLVEYAGETRLIERIENPSLQDVLAMAALRSVEDDAKPFDYERHSEKVFVRLEDSRGTALQWIIPSTWLPVARALWPVHIRRMSRGRPYVSKKTKRQRYDGSWAQTDTPVHSLFLGADIGARVDAADGSYLNYADGNLSVHNALPATIEAREVSLDVIYTRLADTWIPAKPKRIPKQRVSKCLNSHERQVQRWLHGELD
jgi:hypothetical protein